MKPYIANLIFSCYAGKETDIQRLNNLLKVSYLQLENPVFKVLPDSEGFAQNH